jgi:hypothetical protein
VRQVRLLTMFAVVIAAVVFGMPRLGARQAAPGAPSGVKYVVSPGGGVSLQWTHSTGAVTHYVLEAGVVPGAPFLRLPAGSDGLLYGKMPELVPAFTAAGIGSGNFFVRIRGANGAVESAPSNEVEVPVRAGCVTPGAPTNFTQIVRGTLGFLAWNPGNGGQATTYTVRASFVPNDSNPPIQLPMTALAFTLGIPPGSYYVHIVASNACGTSAPSNELLVTAPADTPARTPDPPAGERLPMPDVRGMVFQFANEAIGRGLFSLDNLCPTRVAGPYQDAAHELEARKTQRNNYIDYIVSRLRQIDTRFGYNAKPTRAWVPSVIAGDEIAYHYGSDAPEGSPNAYAIDVLGGHCTGVGVVPNNTANRHTPDYRPFFNEFVRWTGAGVF